MRPTVYAQAMRDEGMSPTAIRILASDLWEQAPEHLDALKLTDVAPPFEDFWIEGGFKELGHYRMGLRCSSWQKRDFEAMNIARTLSASAMLILRAPSLADTPELQRYTEDIFGISQARKRSFLKAYQGDREALDASDFEWTVFATLFVERPGQQVAMEFSFCVFIDKDGRPLVGYPAIGHQRVWTPDMSSTVTGICLLLCFSLSFLNCKNVELVDVAVKQPSKRHLPGKRTIIFKKLLIRNPTKRYKNGEEVEELGNPEKVTRLHLCRGHFADYTKGKGLFGRIKGRFWVPSHCRGTSERGIVIKDYKLDATS
ncbi:MAG: hypothetical protein V3S94_05285 [Gammaproteobacteria bacterium]